MSNQLALALAVLSLLPFALGCGATPPAHRPEATDFSYGPPFARARLLEGTSPLGGVRAEGAAGDWVLENERLWVVVSGLEHSDGFAITGGNLIDAVPRGGADLLREVFTYFDDTFPRQAVYEELVPQEAESTAAVLVARGRDSDARGLRVETRYTLRPGESFLEIVTTLENATGDTLREFELGDAIEWGQAEAFAPGPGWNLPGTRGEIPFLLGSGRGTAYGWVCPQGPLTGPHGRPWSDPIVATVDIPPGGRASYVRDLIVVPGSAADAAAIAWRVRGIESAPFSVTVRGERGTSVPGARVELRDAAGTPAAWGETDADGVLRFWVPEGAYTARVEHPERGVAESGKEEVRTGKDPSVRVSLPEPGTLTLSAKDEAGRPSPARWTFVGEGDTPSPRFGSFDAMPGAGAYLFTPTGEGKFRVPPGRYRVTATRGITNEAWSGAIEVKEGSSLALEAALPRLEIPSGWVSADLHVHADPSFDSNVTLADRARSLACEGVDWFAASDHYRRTDYGPVLDTLALAAPLHALVSEEITTERLGHFGAFPLPYYPDRPRGGGMRTHGMTLDAIFSALQGEGSDVRIQVNHPRAGSDGYFDLLDFDAPGSAKANALRLDFSFLEVLNGKENPKLAQVWRDWMELLLEGYPIVGVGNSDSHRIYDQEVGYPRNLVRLPAGADPGDQGAFLAALRGGRVVATNGPFIEFTLEGTAVGDTVTHPSGVLQGRVRIVAPSWADVRRLSVWVNGAEVATYFLRGRGDPVRFDEEIEVPIRESSFVIVRADGDDPLDPVLSSGPIAGKPGVVRPIAFTNPIWVEVPKKTRR